MSDPLTQRGSPLTSSAQKLTRGAGNLTRDAAALTEAGVPAFLAGDTATREWLKVYDAESKARSWHPSDVEWTLGQAHKLLKHLGGRVGPAAAKGFWPPILREKDEWSEASKNRRASASEVSTMNAAMGWAWAYLAKHDNERESVQWWAFCKEAGLSYSQYLRDNGKTRTTEQLRRRRGMFFIAAGLCRDEIRVPHEVLLARLERPKSDQRADDVDALAVEAQHEAPQPVAAARAPSPTSLPISPLWAACQDAQALESVACGDAVLGLIAARVRAEAGAGLIASDPQALNERQGRLVEEAARRGLLPAGARRTLSLTRGELTARIERNKEDGNV